MINRALNIHSPRQQGIDIKQTSYRLLIVASLLIIPLIFLVYLYLSEINKDLQQAKHSSDIIYLSKLLTRYDKIAVDIYHNHIRKQDNTLNASKIQTQQAKIDRYIHRLPDLHTAWDTNKTITNAYLDSILRKIYTQEQNSLLKKTITIKMDINNQLFHEINKGSIIQNTQDQIIHSALIDIPSLTSNIFTYSAKYQALSSARVTTNNIQFSDSLKELLHKIDNQFTAIYDDIKVTTDLKSAYTKWLTENDRALNKTRMLAFAGMLNQDSMKANDATDNLLSLNQHLIYHLYAEKELRLSRVHETLSAQKHDLNQWRTTLLIISTIIIFLTGFLGFYILTSIRYSQTYMKEQNALLEEGINQRTEELEYAKREAETLAEQAETANQAKSLFLASMSHEIRTPLNSIIGGSEILAKTTLTPKQQSVLKLINQSGATLLELVNDVLDFSKIEAGELIIETIEFDLESIIYDVAHLFSFRMREKNLTQNIEIDSAISGKWQGDPTRIKQIIINLVGNALKFTHLGGITYRVNTADGNIHIAICDTGIGIPKENIGKLFDSFVQNDNSITRKYGGTGLGLSICKRLANLMQGDINVVSVLNQGSTFTLSLPIEQVIKNQTLNQKYQLGISLQQAGVITRLQQCGYATVNSENDTQKCDAYVFNLSNISSEIIHSMAKQHPHTAVIILNDDFYLNEELDQLSNIHIVEQFCTNHALIQRIHQCIENPINIDEGQLISQSHTYHGKLLLVEDVEFNRVIATEIIEDLGLTIACAFNGEMAVEMFLENRYDLILMDLHMPLLDGYAATEAIRKIEEEKDLRPTPIVAMTADVLSDTKGRITDIGMNGYLSKPFEMEDLHQILRSYLPTQDAPTNPHTIQDEHIAKNPETSQIQPEIETPTDIETFDFDRLYQRVRKKIDRVEKLSHSFTNSLEEMHTDMVTGLNNQDYRHLQLSAHALKGSAGNIGAQKISQLAAEIEQLSKDNAPFHHIDTLVTRLPREFKDFKTALSHTLSVKREG